MLATGSKSFDVHLWNTSNGMLLQTFQGHQGDIWSVAFSHDSKLLASASADQTIRIWDSTSTLNEISSSP
jgi:WD40 repeat protein